MTVSAKKAGVAFVGALAVGVAFAGSGQIYDEGADAHQQIAAAIEQASKAGKNILLDFGANW
jgi:uncharacterized membrane protein